MAGTKGSPASAGSRLSSDGVIAIIITIMVLELKAPEDTGIEHLWALWPIAVAYALSFAYVAIYWVNHHQLFSHATRVTNPLIWANLLLLFVLSLVPFSTAYLGTHHFARDATIFYLVTMLLPALIYPWLQSVVKRTGKQGPKSAGYHRLTIRKGIFANLLYLAGIPLSFVSPALGIAMAAIVAILWFLPRGPFDHLFARRKTGQPPR